MHLKRSKKILVYIFLFLLIGTLNNKNINNIEFPKINHIKISGLEESENFEVLEKLEAFKVYNLFFLNKKILINTLYTHNQIDDFFIFKKYPSTLNIKIIKTEFLAYINKDNKNFYVGSNGKLILAKDKKKDLPFIYGDLNFNELINLKTIIEKSDLKFDTIKSLFYFPSGRWDVETRSGILLKLPKSKLNEALELYIDLLNKSNIEDIKKIDLRQNNQVILNG